jgi:hypothetical protein
MKNKLETTFLQFYFCHTNEKTKFFYFKFLKNFGKNGIIYIKIFLLQPIHYYSLISLNIYSSKN